MIKDMKDLKVRQPIQKIDKRNIDAAISMLKGMLEWSERIGSDEIVEIKTVIDLLEKNGVTNKVAIMKMMNKKD